MPKIESAFTDVGYLDRLSYMNTPIHRLDPRAKLITTLVFIIAVVSSDKYEISGLVLFFLYPFVMISLSGLPAPYILKKLLIVAPFALLVGIFNPVFDKRILVEIGSYGISGGWVSFFSIIMRFILTVLAAFILVATTGFIGVCLALDKLKVSSIFAVQLLFLYRYIFVLIDEAHRMVRARALRSFKGKGKGMKVAGSIISNLLLRTINRARRIHLSMLSRGFNGEIHIMRNLRFNIKDLAFIFIWSSLFILMRIYNIPLLMGRIFTNII